MFRSASTRNVPQAAANGEGQARAADERASLREGASAARTRRRERGENATT